jgi:ERCC4-type nuclease
MKLFVDNREDGYVINTIRKVATNPAMLKTLKEKEIEVIVTTLDSGDIVCGEHAIEHKAAADYRASLFSGHLGEQIDHMKRNFKSCTILSSGRDYEIFRDSTGIGSVASFLSQGVPVIPCGSMETMAQLAIKTLHKCNDEKVRDINPNINQHRANDDQLCMITGISGISEEKGNRLLNHFGTVVAIANASTKELEAVDGIGTKLAIAIYSAFHSPRL